jgi:hypothetical protein
MNSVQEIERAIDALTPQERDELYGRLDQRHSLQIDEQLKADLDSGNFDDRIQRALAGQKADQRTGVDLIEALQASPCRELDIEPARFRSPIPARDVTF